MALPEDDVEEVDPEPALAAVLDHEHDALVIGPGLRPSLAIAELLRLLLTASEEPGPPAVLDAEALRTLAAVDEWWSRITRPCVLTPHAGEFKRLRDGSGHAADEDGDLGADDAARAKAAVAAAAEWHQSSCSRAPRPSSRLPTARSRSRRSRTRRWRPAGRGTSSRGTIGALLAQGLAPYDAARLGVYLHGLAGEAVRDRIGDAGLLASDLPDALPIGAQAPRPDGRARAQGPPARVRRPRRAPRAGPQRARAPRERRPERGARADRGAARGRRPPALPRHAWLELDLDALGANLATIRRVAGAGVRVEPVVKADAYGHGAVPIARALASAGADGLSVATVDEAFELRDGGVELPLLVLYPIPPEHVAAAARSGIAVSVGSGALTDAILEAAARAAVAGAPDLGVHVEVETGLGRGGVLPGAERDLVRAILASPGVRLDGVWSHLAAANDLSGARAQDVRFAASLGAFVDVVELGPDRVRRHLAGAADPRRGRGALGCGSPRPVDLRARPGRADAARGDGTRRGDAAPRHGPRRASRARHRPPGGPRRELRAVVRDGAAVADRDPPGRLR